MKPPMNGPNIGPMNTVDAKMTIAAPRWVLSNMSENAAPTMVRGQDPKNPVQNLQIRRVCKSFAVAAPKQKTVKPNIPTNMGNFRPCSSEKGPHMRGPKA